MRPGEARVRGPVTYRLTVEYDGTRFSGWQEQKNAKTVVGELKAALAGAGLAVLDLGGAGRTDAGVHALGQVAHLRLERKVEPVALANALNQRLPGSVHVLSVEPAHPRFHARHDAVSRTYLYQLSRRRTAFAKRFVWWVKEPIDLGGLRQAAALLPGRHDFRLFAEVPKTSSGGTPAREAQASTLVEMEAVEVAEDGALVLLRFTASHFLWRMVRRLAGALVQVGTGALPLAAFEGLLATRPLPAGRGTPAEWTAPASGLFLERVRYRGDGPLPPLAAVTPVSAERLAHAALNKKGAAAGAPKPRTFEPRR